MRILIEVYNYLLDSEDTTREVSDWIITQMFLSGIVEPELIAACLLIYEKDLPEFIFKNEKLIDHLNKSRHGRNKIMKIVEILVDLEFNKESYNLNQVEKYFGSNEYLDSEVRRRIN